MRTFLHIAIIVLGWVGGICGLVLAAMFSLGSVLGLSGFKDLNAGTAAAFTVACLCGTCFLASVADAAERHLRDLDD